MPPAILEKLQKLKKNEWAHEEEFVEALRSVLDEKQIVWYKELILKLDSILNGREDNLF